jgi:hypothetical protein
MIRVIITFKLGIEDTNNDTNKTIEVYTSNNPVVALSEFKPNYYDLHATYERIWNMWKDIGYWY